MSINTRSPQQHTSCDEQMWNELYIWLLSVVEIWVCYSGVPAWRGQQKEISEDIAQEAVMRTFKYNQRAARGEVQPIVSLKSLSRVIAQNHFRDRRRKEQRLIRFTQNEYTCELQRTAHERIDPGQVAMERLVINALIITVAHVMATLPPQQRLALLTDLANASDFDEPPTLLERALSDVGIQLRDYQRPLPENPAERGKYATHLCVGYKRLRQKIEF